MKHPFRRREHANKDSRSAQTAEVDLSPWSGSGVIFLDLQPGLDWVQGTMPDAQYLEESIESAEEEAREEVDRLLEVAPG